MKCTKNINRLHAMPEGEISQKRILAFFNLNKKGNPFKNYRSPLLNELARKYDLNHDQTVVLAAIISESLNDNRHISIKEIAKNNKLSNKAYLKMINNAQYLIDRGILLSLESQEFSLLLSESKVRIDANLQREILSCQDNFINVDFNNLDSILEYVQKQLDLKNDNRTSEKTFFSLISQIASKCNPDLPLF